MGKQESVPSERTLVITTLGVVAATALVFWLLRPAQDFHFTESCPEGQTDEVFDRYMGRWDGKWDQTWLVRLTISNNAETNGFSIKYEHEEVVGQKPLEVDIRQACLVNGRLVDQSSMLTMNLDRLPDEATLVGAFSRKNRYSKLKRLGLSSFQSQI
jgi:hypothetical protein